MEIKCNHNGYRDLTQLAWVIFGNLDGEIDSQLIDGKICTNINFNGQNFSDISDYYEKNCIKRSLYNASMKIKKWDAPWGILTGINPCRLAWNDLDENQLKKQYFVEDFRAKLCVDTAKFAKNIKTDPNDISLYVGIPFCRTKCKYCSFIGNSVDKNNKYQSKYVDCLISELKTVAKCIKNRKLKSIYIGGGTPTALNEADFQRMMKTIFENFDMQNLLEYTVEAGRVDTITTQKLDTIKKYGADRISINPQVFDDEILQNIGRNHTVKEVFDTYEYAKKLNFKAINMDIIYGLGGDFNHTVDTLIAFAPENITMHTLAIKNGGEFDHNYSASLTNIDYFYEKMHKNGYLPYYLYRQQYMVKPYENVGFYKGDTACYYNVCMMQNLTDIVSCGSATTSKISGESYFNNKFPLDYINNIENIITKKQQILKFSKEN